MPCLTRDHTGNHRYGSGGRGSWGQCGQEPLLWFLHRGTGEAACMGFRLVSLNNLSGFRGTYICIYIYKYFYLYISIQCTFSECGYCTVVALWL